MEMASTIVVRYECESQSDAIAMETHLLDFANKGLVELTVTHETIPAAETASEDGSDG